MLKEIAISGVKWTGLSSIIVAVLQFVQLIILSRFLTTGDFGLVAITLSIIGFAAFFMDMGVSSVVIHKQDITHTQLSTLFWVNVIMGIALFIICLSSAPLIAAFYAQPELKKIISLCAIALLITPVEQQYLSLLRKNFLFGNVARRDIFSRIASFVVAIVLGWKGYGAYALVFSYLTFVFISAILIISAAHTLYRPAFCFRFSETRPLLTMGMFQAGDNILGYFNRNIDTLIVGKVLGKSAAGIYGMAKNIASRPSEIINPILTQIAFPVMAKMQKDISFLRRSYLKCVHYIASVNFPVHLFISVCSSTIVKLLLDNEWQAVAPVLQILALYYMSRSIINPIGTLLAATGRFYMIFYWNLILLALYPIIIFLFTPYHLIGVAYALFFFNILLNLTLHAWAVYPTCKASVKEYASQFVFPLIEFAVMFSPLYVINFSTNYSAPIRLVLSSLIALLVFVVLNKCFNKAFFADFVRLVLSSKIAGVKK